MSTTKQIDKVTEMVNAKNKRADERRKNREIAKTRSRYYSYDEVNRIVQNSLAKLKENMNIQMAISMANVLEKEPYDFSRVGICDVIKETSDLIDDINNERVEVNELLEVAARHGVSLSKNVKESSVQVILDRGDDTDGGQKDA